MAWKWTYFVALPLMFCKFSGVNLQEANEAPERDILPPIIINQPHREIAFYDQEMMLVLPCEASGYPSPRYFWTFNGVDFKPSGIDSRVYMASDTGDLTFTRATERDSGYYQCFAENDAGTAVSNKINLRSAFIEHFPVASRRMHYPSLGQPLQLTCIPPRSYPKPYVDWALMDSYGALVPLERNDRITMDPEGNLYFSYIIASDAQEGQDYVCIAQNAVSRVYVISNPNQIKPQGEVVLQAPASLQYASPRNQKIIVGEKLEIYCLFAASPLVNTTWIRIDGEMSAHVVLSNDHLAIDQFRKEDAGQYECQAINTMMVVPIRRSFTVTAVERPYWIEKPSSVDALRGDNVTITCKAGPQPEPLYFISKNGKPLSDLPSDPRRVVKENSLTIYNVSEADRGVIQCNATNIYGYIFENSYINVATYRDCTADEFQCKNRECIPLNLKCDGTPDCKDQSDEHIGICKIGKKRLSKGLI